MCIFEEFRVVIKELDLVWLCCEILEVSSNILFCWVFYIDEIQLMCEGFKNICNEIGKEYILFILFGIYMCINDVDLFFIVEIMCVNGDYVFEVCGIWDIVNDFMGGVFVSYFVYDFGKVEFFFMDVFVYVFGKDKCDLM